MELAPKVGPVVVNSESESGLGTSASSVEVSVEPEPLVVSSDATGDTSAGSFAKGVAVSIVNTSIVSGTIADSTASAVDTTASAVGSISILAGPPHSPQSISDTCKL